MMMLFIPGVEAVSWVMRLAQWRGLGVPQDSLLPRHLEGGGGKMHLCPSSWDTRMESPTGWGGSLRVEGKEAKVS